MSFYCFFFYFFFFVLGLFRFCKLTPHFIISLTQFLFARGLYCNANLSNIALQTLKTWSYYLRHYFYTLSLLASTCIIFVFHMRSYTTFWTPQEPHLCSLYYPCRSLFKFPTFIATQKYQSRYILVKLYSCPLLNFVYNFR